MSSTSQEPGPRGKRRAAGEKAKPTPAKSAAWQRAAPFAVLSLVCFLCGVALLALMLWKAELLAAFGLIGRVYYIVLLPFGLAWGAFLFGVLRSYARYTEKALGRKLELGGPIVGAAIAVIAGFYLPSPDPDAFPITVLVRGESGPHDLAIRSSGKVWMTLGSDRRFETIGDKGEACFRNIPASFRGQEVPVWVEADGFELANPSPQRRLTGESIDVVVRRAQCRLTGRVQDTDGRPVAKAVVRAGDLRVEADADGHFSLQFQGGNPADAIEAEVIASGFEAWRGKFTPSAGPAAIMLNRIR